MKKIFGSANDVTSTISEAILFESSAKNKVDKTEKEKDRYVITNPNDKRSKEIEITSGIAPAVKMLDFISNTFEKESENGLAIKIDGHHFDGDLAMAVVTIIEKLNKSNEPIKIDLVQSSEFTINKSVSSNPQENHNPDDTKE